MIRWTQLNALLPAIQFSIPPWKFSEECNNICRKYAKYHLEISEKIIELAKESTISGEPIIRPIWWNSPTDEIALNCDDQFLLGDDVLVAPVLKPGFRTRDIYLPEGEWKEKQSGTIYSGKQTLHGFPAPLDFLPIFVKVPET